MDCTTRKRSTMERRRFTGKEDVALKEIVDGRETRRVNWKTVATTLEELGYNKRTAKSVRNRHLRQKQYQSSVSNNQTGRNVCRKCGLPQRGHSCLLEQATAESEDKEADSATVVGKE